MYIPHFSDSLVDVFNMETRSITATIEVGNTPAAMTVSSDGKYVFVSNYSDGTISVIHTATNNIEATILVGIEPFGLKVDHNNDQLFVATQGSDYVSIIDLSNYQVVGSIQVGKKPSGIEITADGTLLYVTNNRSGYISVIDVLSKRVIDSIEVPMDPVEIYEHPAGGDIYVTCAESNVIIKIDQSTLKITDTLYTSGSPVSMAFSKDGSVMYVSNRFGNTVSEIDLEEFEIVGTISVGLFPNGIEVHPNGKLLYVFNMIGNSMNIIDLSTKEIVDNVTLNYSPYSIGRFISLYPYIEKGDQCTDAFDVNNLLGQSVNVPQVSDTFNNTITSHFSGFSKGTNCFIDGDSINHTLWYNFTGDGNTYSIRTIDCGVTNYIEQGNTQAAIYKGNCDSLTPLACSEDEGSQEYNFYFELATDPGQEYIMMIDGHGTAVGGFCLEITQLSPSALSDKKVNQLNIFPNPAKSMISWSSDIVVDRIEIIDMMGRALYSNTGNPTFVDVSMFHPGWYIVKIYSDQKTYIEKMLKY